MDPFIGEIRMFGGNFAPLDWSFCDGSLISISQNDALYSLIGTTYGGDGVSTFGIPDLRGRLPVHQGTNPSTGTNYPIGQMAGAESVTLLPNQIPSHTHNVLAGGTANVNSPKGAYLANAPSPFYIPQSNAIPMNSTSTVADGGQNQPHTNIQPYLCITFIISLAGIYPSRN